METQKPMVAEGAHGGNQKCLAKLKKLNREQILQRNDGRDLFHGIAFCSVEALCKT